MHLRMFLGTCIIPLTVAKGTVFSAFRRSIGLTSSRELRFRELSESSSVCWSGGSICDTWGELDDVCDDFGSLTDDWYKCICSSGWVQAHEECDWCMEGYGETGLGDTSIWKESCDDDNLPIAPMPSSILDALASFNATNTWLQADATGEPDSSPTSDKESPSETSDDSFTTTSRRSGGTGNTFPSKTSSRSRSAIRETSTTTMFGGNGGAPLTSTPSDDNAAGATVTVTAGSEGSGGGGASAGPSLKASAILSSLGAFLAMVGVAIFQI